MAEHEKLSVGILESNGIVDKVGGGVVTVLSKDINGKVLLATGTVAANTLTGAGWAKGAIYIKTDAGAGSQGMYINIGTTLAGNFTAPGTIGALNVDTANIAALAVTEAKMAVQTAGLNAARVAIALFDPSAVAGQRTQAAHGLGVTLPDNAIIKRAWYDVLTTFQSTAGGTDKATIAISAEGANDIVAAVAIETGAPWDGGLHDAIEDSTAANMVKLTAARELTATVGVCALTAGKLLLFVEYVVSV